MIAKDFFLAKIIHRIGALNFHDKKSLLETSVKYLTFFTLRTTRRTAAGQLAGATRGAVRGEEDHMMNLSRGFRGCHGQPNHDCARLERHG
jgi:hypothetical protein